MIGEGGDLVGSMERAVLKECRSRVLPYCVAARDVASDDRSSVRRMSSRSWSVVATVSTMSLLETEKVSSQPRLRGRTRRFELRVRLVIEESRDMRVCSGKREEAGLRLLAYQPDAH